MVLFYDMFVFIACVLICSLNGELIRCVMCIDMVLFISRIMVCFDTCGLVCSVMSCRHVMQGNHSGHY